MPTVTRRNGRLIYVTVFYLQRPSELHKFDFLVAMRVVALLLVLVVGALADDGLEHERAILVRNNYQNSVVVHWVDADSGERALLSDPDGIVPGAEFELNSYVWHDFEVKELPSASTGECQIKGKCKVGTFSVSENQDQTVVVDADFKVRLKDHTTIARDQANHALIHCTTNAKLDIKEDVSFDDTMKEMAKCLNKAADDKMAELSDEVAFESSLRQTMGAFFDYYTCEDLTLPSVLIGKSIRNSTWMDPSTGEDLTVKTYLSRPAARVHVIDNFVSDEQCRAAQSVAEPFLKPATVFDADGGLTQDSGRKALQADIDIPWEKELEGDPLALLGRRIYDYAEDVLRLGIDEHGQESLTSIQYTGRGVKDPEPDFYGRHCDGECDGSRHKPGGRVASVVMYCEIPEKGGATNFMHSGLHIVPKKGRAVFFSYIDPDSLMMDTGLTSHSGCPVFEGKKKILTQWIRYGVSQETPWNQYNNADGHAEESKVELMEERANYMIDHLS